jgi:hypothetical protein
MNTAGFLIRLILILTGALEPEETDYRTDLVLFVSFTSDAKLVQMLRKKQMPFLHWDFEELQAKREAIVSSPTHKQIPSHTLVRDQKLVKAYLTDDHPLHIRRTLDQYYYHTLTDTTMRDKDQLLTSYQNKNEMQPRILTMVDQLWLWVLNGDQGKPDIVVSCFPDVEQQEASAQPDPHGLTNVLRCIKLRLLDEPSSVQTAYDLAGLIAATCSRVYFDRASTLSFGNTKSTLQFSELYETEISDIVSPSLIALLHQPPLLNLLCVRSKRRASYLANSRNLRRRTWQIYAVKSA